MSTEALDDPALLVPRVLDVHGTLLRLGFKPCVTKYTSFYRLFVVLLKPVDPPLILNGKRKISHVELLVTYSVDDGRNVGIYTRSDVRIYASYGYPERYKKKLKLIEHFVKLSSEGTSTNVNLSDQDERLRTFEKNVGALILNLQTKMLDCNVEVDSATGLTIRSVTEFEALKQAVHHGLDCHKPDADMWWSASEENEPKAVERYAISGKQSGRMMSTGRNLARVPNFSRRGIRR